jgi:hypothetical protein
MADLRITCGHRSIADAKRAKLELQKHQPGVSVVVGDCPAQIEEFRKNNRNVP